MGLGGPETPTPTRPPVKGGDISPSNSGALLYSGGLGMGGKERPAAQSPYFPCPALFLCMNNIWEGDRGPEILGQRKERAGGLDSWGVREQGSGGPDRDVTGGAGTAKSICQKRGLQKCKLGFDPSSCFGCDLGHKEGPL